MLLSLDVWPRWVLFPYLLFMGSIIQVCNHVVATIVIDIISIYIQVLHFLSYHHYDCRRWYKETVSDNSQFPLSFSATWWRKLKLPKLLPGAIIQSFSNQIVEVGKFEKNVSWQAPKRGAVVKESEVKVETSPCWPSSLPTSSWPSSLPARRAAAATKPAPQTARPPLPPPRSAPLPPPRARPPPPSPPTRRVVAPPASLQPGLNNTKELHPTSGAGAGELSGAGGRQTPARQFSYSFTSRMSRPPPPQVIHTW